MLNFSPMVEFSMPNSVDTFIDQTTCNENLYKGGGAAKKLPPP
jgi:hypothetical protein